ncbi:hypothetical protein FMM75_12775 [Lachnospiraceae bacterium MD335]|jgi:hypothetical protein|nr:hypothetical protein C809_04573 [Lachnospiraceae bacterium MD335]NDO50228.1 hypothetical protein [Lachnospiraceae bacterium MD335]
MNCCCLLILLMLCGGNGCGSNCGCRREHCCDDDKRPVPLPAPAPCGCNDDMIQPRGFAGFPNVGTCGCEEKND